MIDVTQLYCPASGAAEGEDNSTHHMVAPAKGGAQVCIHCRKTQKQLRKEAGDKV